MKSSGYTHILFDHDGVLVNTEPLYFEATCVKLAEFGIEFTEADYLTLQADGLNAWGQATSLGFSQVEIEQKKAERNVLYQELLTTRDIEIPGVIEVLAELAQSHRMAIVTTAKPEDFELIHRHRKIVSFMEFVLTNKDYARSKPAPDPYLTALRRFAIEPQQALIVEDSQRGLKAAVAAGIDCAAVHHPFTQTQDFSEAKFKIESLAALQELLDDH